MPSIEVNGTNGSNPFKDPNSTNGGEALAAEGSLPTSTTLYQGPKDKDKKWTWLVQEPADVADAAENAETAQHALITRLQKAQDSRKKYQIHSLIIQSPYLKEVLGTYILDDYPGICCSLKRLEFEAPFEPFVHRWGKLMEYRNRNAIDATTREHVELLYNTLREELKDVIKTLEDYVDKGVVTFEHIWTVFQPGDIVFSLTHQGAPMALKLRNGKYVKAQCGMAYQLTAEAIDWNGTHFGRAVERINLWEFLGTTPILSLTAFPLSFHPQKGKIRAALTQRGKEFEKLAGCHYKEYNGFAITWDKEGKEVPTSCSGRIIVDSDTFRRFSPRYVGCT